MALCAWFAIAPITIQLMNSPAAAQIASITWSTDVLSQYLGSDTGTRLHDKPVVQSNLNVQLKNGFYLNLWGSKSLDREPPAENFGNEIDYMVGWTGAVGPINADLNVAYWDISDRLLFQGHGDVVQLTIEVSKEFGFGVHTITPYVKLEPTFPLDGTADGAYVHVGVRHKLNLTDSVAFTQGGRIIYDSGVFGNVSGYNFRYDSAFAWNLSKNVTLRLPTLRAFLPITDLGFNRRAGYIFGAGFDVNY